jgi:hypothetical protein
MLNLHNCWLYMQQSINRSRRILAFDEGGDDEFGFDRLWDFLHGIDNGR